MMNTMNKTYLVACSGGPDSMALLHMLIMKKVSLMIAHVNYKTRKESDMEEQLVKNFANKYHIPCFVKVFDISYKGSFEAAARQFRYQFFKEIYQNYHCNGLFVAHHMDDLLETYLLKKQRNVINQSYLIEEETYIYNMNVYRPLLYKYSKEDLLNYCQKNQIPYSIDITNFMDIHPRNIIRKKLLTMDKQAILKEALNEEKSLKETRLDVLSFIASHQIYFITDLKDKSDLWLRIFLYETCPKEYQKYVNKSLLLKLKDFFKSDKANLSHFVHDHFMLEKRYQQILYNLSTENGFCYRINTLKYVKKKEFSIVKKGIKMHGIFVSEEDFPLTIRTFKMEDKILLKEGNKKVSRLFIDKKVPLSLRNQIPVIENQHHEILFVYGLYRKYGLKDVHNNLYLKLHCKL